MHGDADEGVRLAGTRARGQDEIPAEREDGPRDGT
jgi:hypothetical protein